MLLWDFDFRDIFQILFSYLQYLNKIVKTLRFQNLYTIFSSRTISVFLQNTKARCPFHN